MTWNEQSPQFLNDHALLRAIIKKIAILPANSWTLLRLVGILAIIYIDNYWLMFIFFIFFLLTDGIDGLVARSGFWSIKILDPFYILYKIGWIKRKTYLHAGEWFDPLADKVFIISIFIYLGIIKDSLIFLPFFITLVGIEVIGRVCIIVFRKMLCKKKIVVRSNYFGKIKFNIEAIIGILLFSFYLFNFSFNPFYLIINLWVVSQILFSIASTCGHIFVEQYEEWGFFPPQRDKNN